MSGELHGQFDIHDPTTHLSHIIERVENGEEIVISRAETAVVRVIRVNRRVTRRRRGLRRGP